MWFIYLKHTFAGKQWHMMQSTCKKGVYAKRQNTQMSLKVKREAKNGHVKTKLQFYGEDILG